MDKIFKLKTTALFLAIVMIFVMASGSGVMAASVTVKKPTDFQVKNVQTRTVTVSAKRKGIVDGYEVRFRSGDRDWSYYRVSTTGNLFHKYAYFKEDWTYQFQVRAYRKIGDGFYPSQWTEKKNVVIKK